MQARMTNPAFLLPDAMQAMFALNKSIEGKLPLRTRKLVHLRASQINGCSVCVDMHAKELQKEDVPLEHIFAVARQSPRQPFPPAPPRQGRAPFGHLGHSD